MTYEQIEKEFDEFYQKTIMAGGFQYPQGHDKVALKSFLKQSFIKYLQGEVERLGNKKHYGDNPFEISDYYNGHDTAISSQITNLQAQIKELEV